MFWLYLIVAVALFWGSLPTEPRNLGVLLILAAVWPLWVPLIVIAGTMDRRHGGRG